MSDSQEEGKRHNKQGRELKETVLILAFPFSFPILSFLEAPLTQRQVGAVHWQAARRAGRDLWPHSVKIGGLPFL